MSFCVLHVDDDPDIREIVQFTLGLDPAFTVTSCAGGEVALAMATDSVPDLILCDVMMPGMDGLTMLARLRESPKTAATPLIFMTARAQTQDVEQFKALGAVAVITKPFDPVTLAEKVRAHLSSTSFGAANHEFAQRLRSDAGRLEILRDELRDEPNSTLILGNLRSCAHKLAGAAGVFAFQVVSCAASSLEDAVIERQAARGVPGMVETSLNALLECMEHEDPIKPKAVDTRDIPAHGKHAIQQDSGGGRDDG
jgi:CheY-like chemotaxis protein